MATGFRAYGEVLADPAARAFSATGFVARLPMAMTGIGTVLLVSLSTGSFTRAGLVSGVGTACGAVLAPLWGRLMDRVGQAVVLALVAALYAAGVALLVASVLLDWPLPLALAGAALTAGGFTPVGSSVRVRWSERLTGSPLLQTAFAVEAVLDELVFIVGPVLVTFLATTVDPSAGLVAAAVLGPLGALALAAQRRTQPPRRRHTGTHARNRLPLGLLLAVVVANVASGGVFGGMEVVVVAFARDRDVLPYSGALLTCWAVGSLVAGLVTGTLTWRRPPATRLRIGATGLAVSLLPMPFVGAPVLMGALLLASGCAIAPTMIASLSVVQSAVPPARITEALGWCSTGLAIGVAAGAASLGAVVDRLGSSGGFAAVVGFGVLMVGAVLLVRTPHAAPGPGLA